MKTQAWHVIGWSSNGFPSGLRWKRNHMMESKGTLGEHSILKSNTWPHLLEAPASLTLMISNIHVKLSEFYIPSVLTIIMPGWKHLTEPLETSCVELAHPRRPTHRHLPPALAVCKGFSFRSTIKRGVITMSEAKSNSFCQTVLCDSPTNI